MMVQPPKVCVNSRSRFFSNSRYAASGESGIYTSRRAISDRGNKILLSLIEVLHSLQGLLRSELHPLGPPPIWIYLRLSIFCHDFHPFEKTSNIIVRRVVEKKSALEDQGAR